MLRITVLPMYPMHQNAIKRGSKTTTFRGEKLRTDRLYKMVCRRTGLSVGYLRVTARSDDKIIWTDLSYEKRLEYAQTEGYEYVALFEESVRTIAGGAAFIDGTRGMYLHTIEYVEHA